MGVAINKHSRPIAGVGIAGYLVSAPVVHVLHRRPGAAMMSGLLRLGLPLGGYMLGAAFGSSSCTGRCGGSFLSPAEVWGAIGAAVGVITAPIIDAAVLPTSTRFDRPPVTPLPTPQTQLQNAPTPPMLRWGGTF